MDQKNTKERILDVGEELFARIGYANTSLRAITGRAGVNLAAVNYHFGSKEALLAAVIERRLVPLNRERSARLAAVADDAARQGRRPEVDATLRAFIEPTLAYGRSGPGAKNFIVLIGRALADPDSTVRSVFMRHIRALVVQLHDTLCAALPELPAEVVFLRLHFVLGAMGHALFMVSSCQGDETGQGEGRCPMFPPALAREVTPEMIGEMFITFAINGIGGA